MKMTMTRKGALLLPLILGLLATSCIPFKCPGSLKRELSRIAGVELLFHDDPGSWCGAAGIYNLTHRRRSQAGLDHKLDTLEAVEDTPRILGCCNSKRAVSSVR